MQITLPPDLAAKLSQLADARGSTPADLAREALEWFVAHQAWFAAEVEKGIADADAGRLIDHADVRAWIDRRFPPKG